MTGATFILFFKIVFHSVQLRISLISSLRKFFYVMRYSVFKMECTVLIFLFEKQLFKEHYVIHLIFKNDGINNIFPSQTSFLLLSSDTRASFANKPIKFCGRTACFCRRSLCFAVKIFIYEGIFLLAVFLPNSEGCTRVMVDANSNPPVSHVKLL